MDKTISISLGGFSFIVDDRAYLKLKSYLDEIRHSLRGMEGTDDIIADVETRIAELFKERLGVREVVNQNDVDHIIEIMGRPEQYVDEEEAEGKAGQTSYRSTSTGEKVKRKLYRDPDDKLVAGVLSGLAHYFGIETWITRVLWIVLFFADTWVSFTSITVVGYIVLWIILPKAETASQKYEMYGQAGDFETIKKNASQATNEMKGVASEASNVLAKLVQIVGKIILVFIGVMLICTGIGLIIAAISILVTSFAGMPVEFFGYVFDYGWQETLARFLAVLLFTIPALLCIIFGARLISSRAKINRVFVFSSIGIWILAIISASIMGVSLGKNFMNDIEYADKKSYSIEQDTITIMFSDLKHSGKYHYKWFRADVDDFVQFNGSLHKRLNSEDVIIRPSKDQNVTVEILYKSHGKNMDNARENAEKIQYTYNMKANGELEFNNYITLPKGSKFRGQDVKIVVYVPQDKVIYAKNIDDIVYHDEKNDSYQYESGYNKFYKFVDGELICQNCGFDDDDEFAGDKVYYFKAGSDSAQVRVSREGVHIENGKDKVIIKKKKIKISDGTDSLNINISDN